MSNAPNLGTATGRIVLDPSGVRTGMEEAKRFARDGFSGFKDIVVGGMQQVGQTLTGVGTQMTAAMAPVGAAFAVATKTAVDFDETMTNVGAVLNLTRDEIDTMKVSIREFGETSRFGPDEVAKAFYDVVGGVSDASLHMAILEQSIRTAEAGNSDLGATTKALISIMNSYKLSAEDAGLASDVLTRTVGMGVGTMDELAAAMPQVTGLAQSLNIPLDELGSMFAYLSTQGNTFSQSGTQVSAMMTALLNPNEKMKDALAAIGQTTGKAAVENLGLVGTYEALLKAGFGDEMAGMTGSVEALRGVTALTGEGVDEFFTTFEEGLEGATDAAREVQMGSAAAQIDLLKSSAEGLAGQVGESLLPNLISFVQTGREVIGMVSEWITKNPELTEQILQFLGVMVAAGPVLMGVGQAISVTAGLLSAMLSPIGLIIALVSGLYLAFQSNFLGIRDIVTATVNGVRTLIQGDLAPWINYLWISMKIGDFHGALDAIASIFIGFHNKFYENIESIKNLLPDFLVDFLDTFIQAGLLLVVEFFPKLHALYDWFVGELPTIKREIATFGAFFTEVFFRFLTHSLQAFVAGIRDWLIPGLILAGNVIEGFINVGREVIAMLKDWMAAHPEIADHLARFGALFMFVVGRLKNLQMAFGLLSAAIIPILSAIGGAIASLLSPITLLIAAGVLLYMAYTENWGGLRDIVDESVAWILQTLQALYDWFVTDGIPWIGQAIADAIAALGEFRDFLGGVWDYVAPKLQALANWFTSEGMPWIEQAIADVITALGQFRDFLGGVWDYVAPKLQALANWFIADGIPWIKQAIADAITKAGEFRDFLAGVWDTIAPKLQEMYAWFVETAFPAIKQELAEWIPGIQEAINILKGWWDEISPALQNIYDWFITTALPFIAQAIQDFIINYVESMAEAISTIWETVSPWLLKFYEWFKVNGLPLIAEAITTYLDNTWGPFIKGFSRLIDEAGPALNELKRIIQDDVMPAIRQALKRVGDAIQDVKDAFNRIWDAISGNVNEFKKNIENIMDDVADAIEPIIDLIDDIISGLDKVKSAGGLLDKAGDILPFASGGAYPAGKPRIVGEGGIPEIDVPDSSGMVVSGDQLATALNVLAGGFRNVSALTGMAAQTLAGAQAVGGGGGISIGSVNIAIPEFRTDNPRQAGREIAVGFEEKLEEIRRSRG